MKLFYICNTFFFLNILKSFNKYKPSEFLNAKCESGIKYEITRAVLD